MTLEPCAHTGQTPPCADALVRARIARCVIAMTDPDPRTAGQGAARLRAAGIDVVTGVREDEARRVNAGFLHRLETGRPLALIDHNTIGYDRSVSSFGESNPETALRKLGANGVLRLRLVPGSAAASAALEAGLAKDCSSGAHTRR